MFHIRRTLSSFALWLLLALTSIARDPNVILIFTDDQGYNDLSCFGSETIRTPNIDAIATNGIRLTDFHVPSPVCSPSRAGLLTGCYPKRVGMHRHVLFPKSTYGLNPDELTIADHLKANGYATACIGKWHLGHLPEFLPRAQGFESYFGIPYSNDMNHPANERKSRIASDALWADQATAVTYWNTPLVRNEEIVELPVDQRTITRRYTDEAIKFITTNKDQPFFLYLPHSMPHIPLYVPDDVYDSDPANAYKNVIEHIDAETGRITKTLQELGIEKDTIVIYTTDNGPWLRFKNHGGSAKPLRDGKGTTFEGGQRVPCVISWPGQIPSGKVSDELASTIDLLPTIATLTGKPLDPPRKIDGVDLSKTLLEEAKSPRDEFLHYSSNGQIEGIRQGDWKLLVKKTKSGKPQLLLFDLSQDIGESNNLATEHPEKVDLLRKRMTKLDAEITTTARPVGGTLNR
ncbi:sulfatase family protein [Haloferula sp.]|uniref:sulfatase family protein n=1 Tax=Haloferula sp. TaxID=2497595 RepID=UPI003C75C85F